MFKKYVFRRDVDMCPIYSLVYYSLLLSTTKINQINPIVFFGHSTTKKPYIFGLSVQCDFLYNICDITLGLYDMPNTLALHRANDLFLM